jgi:hypothetical protein
MPKMPNGSEYHPARRRLDNKSILTYNQPIQNIREVCSIWRYNMALVKKTIELDQDQINRIKTALRAKSEKEAINIVLKQFDVDIQLAEVTIDNAGTFEFEEI